jgi:hypothetical protein
MRRANRPCDTRLLLGSCVGRHQKFGRPKRQRLGAFPQPIEPDVPRSLRVQQKPLRLRGFDRHIMTLVAGGHSRDDHGIDHLGRAECGCAASFVAMSVAHL